MRSPLVFSLTINNAVVVSRPVYSPKFVTADNKVVTQRCNFIVFAKNSDNKGEYLSMVIWGHGADSFARRCAPGTKVDMKVRPGSYIGVVHNLDGSELKDSNGVTVTVRKTVFTVTDIIVNGMIDKAIKAEIKEGLRPAKWDNPLHQDYNVWQAHLKIRNEIVYDGKSETFVYADVRKPGEPAACKVLDEYKGKVRHAHIRAFKHPRFVHMKGKQIAVKEVTVDPKL